MIKKALTIIMFASSLACADYSDFSPLLPYGFETIQTSCAYASTSATSTYSITSDTLDSQHGSYYAVKSEVAASTETLQSGKMDILTYDSDADNIVDTSAYSYNSGSVNNIVPTDNDEDGYIDNVNNAFTVNGIYPYDADEDGLIDTVNNAAYSDAAGYSNATAAHTHTGGQISGSITTSSLTVTGNQIQTQVSGTNIAAISTMTVPGAAFVIADNGYVYVMHSSTITIFEAKGTTLYERGSYTHPEMPTAGGHIAKGGNLLSVSCVMSNKVFILNVSDPYRPSLAGIIAEHLFTPKCSQFMGASLFVMNAGVGLVAFDVSNPSSPRYLSTTAASAGRWLEIEGTTGYGINQYGDNLLRIWDLSNPTTPVLSTASPVMQLSNAVSCKPKGDGRYLAIADTYTGKVKLADISNKFAPVWVSTWNASYINGPMQLAWSGDNLFYSNWATYGVTGISFADPKIPAFVATFKMANNAADSIAVYEDGLYGASSAANDFRKFSLTTTKSPNAIIGVLSAGETSVSNLSVARNASVAGSGAFGGSISAGGSVTSISTSAVNYLGGKTGIGMTPSEKFGVFGNIEAVSDSTKGSNIISDPDFTTGVGWTAATGWTVAGGGATYQRASAATLTQSLASLSVPAKGGRYYKLTYTVVTGSTTGGAYTVGVVSGGSGYVVGDSFQITGGGAGDCIGKVTYQSGGAVTQVQTTYGGAYPGTKYVRSPSALATTTLTGGGSGLTVYVGQIVPMITCSVTTAFAETEKYLDMSEGTHDVIFKSAANPTAFVLSASAPGASSIASITIDNLVLEELQGGDVQAHRNIRGNGVKYDTGLYTVGVTTPTSTFIEIWASDYKKYISTGTSNAWDWLQLYP